MWLGCPKVKPGTQPRNWTPASPEREPGTMAASPIWGYVRLINRVCTPRRGGVYA